MKIQNIPGIYVYFIKDYTKQEQYYYFKNVQELVKYFNAKTIETLVVTNSEDIYREVRNVYGDDEYRNIRYYCHHVDCKFYYICDHNGRQYSKEFLIVERHKYSEEWNRLQDQKWRNRWAGRKRPAWGHYHHISGVRTRRNNFVDEDVQELDIVVKYRKKAVTPDSWDVEKWTHNEKCWKKQRKVRHQWDRK